MDDTDMNGGNAEIKREYPNLEGPSKMLELKEEVSPENVKMEDQEVNGDFADEQNKVPAPVAKRNMRSSKANSTSTNEDDAKSPGRGKKRKLSEPDISSDDSDFNGFELSENLEPANTVLKKLIAEVESTEDLQIIRRFSSSKSVIKDKIFELKQEDLDTDSVDNKMKIDEDKDFHKAGDTLSISGASSANSSPSASSQKSRSNRLSRGASPGSAIRQKVSLELSNPAYKEPFKFGWKRELVYRSGSEANSKKLADVYYYTPKGKKVRSFRELAEYLKTKDLLIDNFTFTKEPLGLDDPEKEIIRDAKKSKDSIGSAIASSKKLLPVKKSTPAKKPVEETTVTVVPPLPVSPPVAKNPVKSPKATPIATPKAKVPAKKTLPKGKAKPPVEETEMRPPQWSTPAGTRKSVQPVEKSPPPKNKRPLKAKVQEPCSIRCSTSMGLIPSLQCCVCLCLYHPECVGGMEAVDSEDYVCKNCQHESDETQQPQQPMTSTSALTPPPLIPISALGVSNAKLKHQMNTPPPKLQRIPKPDNSLEKPIRASTRQLKVSSNSVTEKRSTSNKWYAPTGKEFLQNPDGTIPKPAQNIAIMAGKKYIVVPKNNSMAVQPAITTKSDKIGDQPPLLQNKTSSNPYDVSENSITSHPELSIEPIERTDINLSGASSNVSMCESLAESRLEGGPSSNAMLPAQNEALLGCNNYEPFENMASNLTEEENGVYNNQRIPDVAKKPVLVETDQRQNFMVSVCAGYHALSRIFQYLKVQELLRAARVCKMWRDLAAHPALWKTVRMKNSQVTDWSGLADSLKRHGTQHLDLRKMLYTRESDEMWHKFVSVIPAVSSLVKLELCRCPGSVVEEIFKSCPQLEVLSAMSIKCDFLSLEAAGNLKRCQELRLKAVTGMSIKEDLSPLQELTQLTHLSLTSIKELGKKKIELLRSLENLETLELGECSDFPEKFGTSVLMSLRKLERLRLEKGQGSCCTFDILEGVSQMESLIQLELINFDVKNGFDKWLAKCKNIKKLLIIPTYISQSATSNNMVLGGVIELSSSLTHFVWGVTFELLKVTELFVDQENHASRESSGDCIPILKPVPYIKLIKDVDDDKDNQEGGDKQQQNLTLKNPQVEILSLTQIRKLLFTVLPKTRVNILKMAFHATWRQSISDTTT